MSMPESVGREIRAAVNAIANHGGFAAAVVITLALGIGANAAVFSVLNGVVLHPLPYGDPDALVRVHASMPRANIADANFSVREIGDLRTQTGSLTSVAEIHVMYFILLGRDEPERVSTGVVSANYFRTLGARPVLGRDFRPEDDEPGAPAVLLLSHAYWQRQFGGDPQIVGRVFTMNDRAHTVIGVLPPLPDFPETVSVYMPTSACPFRSNPRTKETREIRFVSAIARLTPQVAVDRLTNDLAVVASRFQQSLPASYPSRAGYALAAMPLQEELTRAFRPTLLILTGTSAFLLLVLCCSVAALMLARAIHRERETTLRTVLGASRRQLFRQFFTESALLVGAGALLGVGVAYQSLGILRSLAARFTPRAADISLDGRVWLFVLGVAALTTLIFSCVTTFASNANPATVLRSSTRTATSRQPLFKALVVMQIAVTFALLVGAGLMIRSLLQLQRVDTGLQTDNVLTLRVALDFIKHPAPANRAAVYARMLDELTAIPGVEMLSAASTVPLNEGPPVASSPLLVEGRDSNDGAPVPRVTVSVATGEYFKTVGVTLLQGRVFTRADDLHAAGVAIVNRSFAQRYWGTADPVGHRIRVNSNDPWLTIVGVVSDARQRLSAAPADEVFRPLLQQPLPEARFFVRSGIPPGTLQRQLRDAIKRVDAAQPVESFQTLAEVRDGALASPRLTAVLLAVFALVALVISATGVAGVVGFSVNQRTREFGTVMALGAKPEDVLRQVLAEGARLAAIGLALGCVGAFVLSRSIATLLFNISPFDPLTFVIVAATLTTVTVAAAFAPARRAACVDPMIALRAA